MKNKQLELIVEKMIERIGYNETISVIASMGYLKAIEQNGVAKDTGLYKRSLESASVLDIEDEKIIYDCFSGKSSEDIANSILDCITMDNPFSQNTPVDLCNLAIDLLDIQRGDKVCDFGCGFGSFLANVLIKAKEADFNLDVSGMEINPNAADVSRIILSLLGKDNSKIENGNVIDSKQEGYSKAFTFPPLAMKMFIGSEYRTSKMCPSLTFSNRNNTEWLFIDRMLSGLVKGGRAVAFVCGRALFSKQDKPYRDFLLKKGMIESIIELPSNLLFNTSINIYVIVFSSENKYVKLVDAGDCFFTNTKKRKFLDKGKVLGLLNSDSVTKKLSEKLEICENLIPSVLMLKVKKPSNAKTLGEVSKIIAGCQYTASHFEEKFTDEKDGICILTPNDIQNGMIDFDGLRKINSCDKRMDKFALKQGDVIITTKSSKFKTAVVDIDPDNKIIAIGGILIIRPDSNIINPTYLKIYLDSPDGQCALRLVRKGVVILTINPKDLESLLVPVPDMTVQNSKADKYNALMSTFVAYFNEMKKIERKISEFSLDSEE